MRTSVATRASLLLVSGIPTWSWLDFILPWWTLSFQDVTRRGPDKRNAPPEIDCENNRTNRACLLARLLLEFARRRLFAQRISQLSSQNKNVTGAIGCRSSPVEV